MTRGLPVRRDTIGVRRRRHVRRQLSLPGLDDLSLPDIGLPGVNQDVGTDTDTGPDSPSSDEDALPGPGPGPTPAAAPPPPAIEADVGGVSTPVVPAPAISTAVPSVAEVSIAPVSIAAPAPVPSTTTQAAAPAPAPSTAEAPSSSSTSSSSSSSTIAAIADSLPTSFETVTRPLSVFLSGSDAFRTVPPYLQTASPTDDDDDSDDDLPTATIEDIVPTESVTGTSTNNRPAIAPTDPSLAFSDGLAPESKTAIAAVVSIISISLFVGILYCLLRFFPPVRDRWTAWKLRRSEARLKRMGLDGESPLPAPVMVVGGSFGGFGGPRLATREQPYASTWAVPTASGGLGVRNIGVENGVVRPLSEAHLRPPSYRSHWTASGQSWVANGFRPPPQRISNRGTMANGAGPGVQRNSQRLRDGLSMRWSNRSLWGAGRFMGRGAPVDSDSGTGSDSRTVSSVSGGGLIADGMIRSFPQPPQPSMQRSQSHTHPQPLASAPVRNNTLTHNREVSRLSSSTGTSSRSSRSRNNNPLPRIPIRVTASSPSPSISPISSPDSNFNRTRSPNTNESSPSSRSQAAFSTNARISDMSSLSAGTRSNAFAPPPLPMFRFPVSGDLSGVTGIRRSSRASEGIGSGTAGAGAGGNGNGNGNETSRDNVRSAGSDFEIGSAL